jgi:Protein of unknown function (DUF4012)
VLVWCGVVIGLGIVWIAVTGLLARQETNRIEKRLQVVKILISRGEVADARRVAADIPSMAKTAHKLTTGPAWWAASSIPWFGDPFDVVRGTTTVGHDIAQHSIPKLMVVAGDLDPSKIRSKGDTIDTAALTSAAPDLISAAAVLKHALTEIDNLPHGTWLNIVDHPRENLQAQLNAITGYVDAAARAAKVLPDMLGANGTRRYFIALQNEAEARGTGGLPGAFAIAEATHGTVKLTKFASDTALTPKATHTFIETGLKFGDGYDKAYGASDPTRQYVDSNVSPNFPYAAQIWAAMWEKTAHQHIDGAIALDPTVLSYFLSVTGPVTLPGGQVVEAGDVVQLTQRDEYAIFNDNNARKDFLVSILRASSTKLLSGKGNPARLAQAVSFSASQGRMLVWSANPRTEEILQETHYSGAIPQSSRPLSALILNNSAAGKLDYYVTRTIDYHRSGCGKQRDVIVTVTLTNTAPASGLPLYVTTRLDKDRPAGVKPGDTRVLFDYYATNGAQLQSVTLNGKPSTAGLENDLGHPIFRMDLELPRGTTQTVVLHLTEPQGTGTPLVWRQPAVSPAEIAFYDQACH